MQAARHDAPPPRAELGVDVVRAAARRQPWAQRAVLERYQRPVWALVERILARAGHVAVVEDATQEALAAVLRALPRFDPDGPARLTTWVLTIATRVALAELRRNRMVVVPIDDRASERDDPERGCQQRVLRRAIVDAVETLGPELRAAFVLRAYHELAYAEIAEILGIDPGTVKSRLWRARAELQRRLGGLADDR